MGFYKYVSEDRTLELNLIIAIFSLCDLWNQRCQASLIRLVIGICAAYFHYKYAISSVARFSFWHERNLKWLGENEFW